MTSQQVRHWAEFGPADQQRIDLRLTRREVGVLCAALDWYNKSDVSADSQFRAKMLEEKLVGLLVAS